MVKTLCPPVIRRLPRSGARECVLPVPSSLFTNGWIHVLEDSELVLLLIAARMRSRHGDTPQPLPSGARKLHYGLSRDSFEAAHRMLDYLGILDVISDYQRNADGKVDGFRDGAPNPISCASI